MPEHPYLPGKAIILSRLPAKDWFTIDEAAEHSGWCRTFIRQRVKSGELPGQQYHKPVENRNKNGRGTHNATRIHVDDLVVFIMRNGNGRYTEEKPFRDVVSVIRSWPVWMIRELHKAIARLLPAPSNGTGQAPATSTTGTDSEH